VASLKPRQQEAVNDISGPLLVLQGGQWQNQRDHSQKLPYWCAMRHQAQTSRLTFNKPDGNERRVSLLDKGKRTWTDRYRPSTNLGGTSSARNISGWATKPAFRSSTSRDAQALDYRLSAP